MFKNKCLLFGLVLFGASFLQAGDDADRERELRRLAKLMRRLERLEFAEKLQKSEAGKEVVGELMTNAAEKAALVTAGAIAGCVAVKKGYNYAKSPSLWHAQRFTAKQMGVLSKRGSFEYPASIRADIFKHRDKLLANPANLKKPAVMVQILNLEHLLANTRPVERVLQETRLNRFLDQSGENLK